VSAPGGVPADQQGGGAWGRIITGSVDTKADSTSTLDLSRLALTATGTQNCQTTTRQDYQGYQVGHDISILNQGGTGANLHFGITAGYFDARTRDITSASTYTNPNFAGFTFNSPAGSFEADTQVPFVGIYTAYSNKGLFADGQVRWDFFQNTLSDASNGLNGQRLDARGFSVTGNVGYSIPLPSGWFIEPSGGVVWSRVNVDTLNVAGVVLPTGFVVSRGSVDIDDIDSVLGRASVRVGANITSGQNVWQPFFTASLFHEFAGDVTATSVVSGTGNAAIDGVTLRTSTSGVGTYAQFGLGTALVFGNTGWLSFVRGDYRTGENIDGWSVNAGLRYQFTPEPGRASTKDAAPVASRSYNWTGPYIGAYVGSTWGQEDWTFRTLGTTSDPDFAGYIVGGQVGYNLQRGRVVYGIEADYGYSDAHGGVSCPNGNLFTCQAEANRLASLTGRLGYTFGRVLVYAKGGLAAGEVTAQTVQNQGLLILPSNTPLNGSSNWQTGWTLGGGMEFALTDRWSAKAEYMHHDLGSDTFAVGAGPLVDATTKGDTVRIGVNLHFQPPK
jgi:opacity protein-like surface antigen